MEWTNANIATLRQHWANGVSTAEIARRMGTTKNSVLGKSHRLHLPARPSPIVRVLRITGPRNPKTRHPPAFTRTDADRREPGTGLLLGPTLPPLTLPGLRLAAAVSVHGPRACCWPFGDPRTPEFRFCGEPVAGRSYCADHLAQAYLPTRRQEVADAA